jgi:hypothetical protein
MSTSPSVINVRVGTPQPRVTAINYGGSASTLRGLTDVKVTSGIQDGDVLVYNGSTQSFDFVTPQVGQVDGGTF